jgi:hypothetical protein
VKMSLHSGDCLILFRAIDQVSKSKRWLKKITLNSLLK